MDRYLAHGAIAVTVLLGVVGQMILKWQVGLAGPLPSDTYARIAFLLRLLMNPWVVLSLGSAFLAMLTWMLALSKLDLSYAYPFTSLAFVALLILSVLVFNEPLTAPKVLGTVLIVSGLIIASR
jgi:multidrug transporter EmrE-like cation transporter